jgi:hypothetical protein
MDGMDRIRKDIKGYREENGKEYEKILISKKFYEQLHEEASQKNLGTYRAPGTMIDFPCMKIVKDVDYDFRLLP